MSRPTPGLASVAGFELGAELCNAPRVLFAHGLAASSRPEVPARREVTPCNDRFELGCAGLDVSRAGHGAALQRPL